MKATITKIRKSIPQPAEPQRTLRPAELNSSVRATNLTASPSGYSPFVLITLIGNSFKFCITDKKETNHSSEWLASLVAEAGFEPATSGL